MAKKTPQQEPAIRKSFLIMGGVAIAAVLLGFIVMNFVLGGDDPNAGGGPRPAVTGGPAAPGASAPDPTPQPSDVPGLRPGGRDPFALGNGAPAAPAAPAASAAPVEVAAASVDNAPTSIRVLAIYGSAVDLKVGDVKIEGAKAGSKVTERFDLDEIDGDCVYMKDAGERFKVCSDKSVKR